jgi:hypothetical protein
MGTACGGTPWLEPVASPATTNHGFNSPPDGVGQAGLVEPLIAPALPASMGAAVRLPPWWRPRTESPGRPADRPCFGPASPDKNPDRTR